MTAAPVAAADPGEALWWKFACASCHRLGGEGGVVGPALDQVTLRRSPAWLARWLDDPARTRPGTLMPRFPWQPGDIEAMVAYLGRFATPVNGAALVEARGRTPETGANLVQAYGCGACHRVGTEAGRALYPDLTTLAARRSPAWERRWLADPEALIPGTFMPDFHLSEGEIEAIVVYLYRTPAPP